MQFDDFEDNINLVIKWMTTICLIVIIIWGLVNLVKLFIPSDKKPTKPAPQEMIKTKSDINDDEALLELLGTDNNKIAEDEVLSLVGGKEAILREYSNRDFKAELKIPDKLYYEKIKNNNARKKREIINQKVGVNYIDTVLSYGELERWNPESFPLKVYISNPKEVPASHVAQIKKAFNKWEEATKDFIGFEFVDNPNDANVICLYPQNFYRPCDSDKTSETSDQYFTYDKDGYIQKSNIELTYKDCNNEIYSDDIVYSFALYEIGRSLGLRGYDGMFQNKVMYYSTTDKVKHIIPEINLIDINTLKLIYSVLPNKTNKDFSEEQKKKLIDPENIWGNTLSYSPTSEKALLYNLERSPEVPSLHIVLGNYYQEHGNYEKALELYSKSIVLLNDSAFKARVYIKIGEAYSSQHRYLEALEAYKLSLKSLNNKTDLFNTYFNLGYIYYQQKKYNEALKAYQNAIQFVSDKEIFYKLLMNMTCIYVKVGNFSDAQKCAEKAYSIDQNEESIYLTAYTKLLNQNYADAEKYMLNAVEKYNSEVNYALLAQIYYDSEQFEKLANLTETVSEKYPNNPPFIFK